MRKIFTLSMLMALSASITAQTKTSWMPSARHQQHLKKVSAFLTPGHTATAGKPTATQERVVAQVINEPGFFDSVAFTYSGTRGSRFDYNNMELMYSYELSADYAPIPTMIGYPKPMDMLADSIISINGNQGLYSIIVGSYRDDNKLDSFYELGNEKVVNSYDANGYLIGQNTFNIDSDGVVITDGTQRKISYNASYTQVAGDSLFDAGGSSSLIRYTTYAYGSDDLVDTLSTYWENGSGMELSTLVALSYDAEGRVEVMQYEEYYNGVSSYKTIDTLTYIGNTTEFSSWISYYEEEGVLLESNLIEKVVNSAGLIDSLKLTYTDLIEEETEGLFASFSYTDMNNPESINIYVPGLPSAITTFSFYYETYDDGVGIDETKTELAFEVYPNPFTHELYLSADREAGSNPMMIRLMDLQGREVYNTTFKKQTGAQKLQLPELPNGIYQLLLQDASGNTATKKLVKIK